MTFYILGRRERGASKENEGLINMMLCAEEF